MDNEILYQETRKELNNDSTRNSTTRSWAVGLAGGVAALSIQKMTSVPDAEALINKQPDIIALVIAGGAFLHIALWYVIHETIKSIIRMGIYLLEIERLEGLERGWEHFVWFREVRGLRLNRARLGGDVMFWIAVAYSVIGVILAVKYTSCLTIIVSAINVFLLAIGTWMRVSTGSYRKKAYRQLTQLFDDKLQWKDEIDKVLGL